MPISAKGTVLEVLNDHDYVLRQIEERDIHFIRLWFTDALGNLKSLAVTDSEIESALEQGMGFDASSIAGFCDEVDSHMLAFPIASSFQVLPWRPKDNGVARMFCDVRTPDGMPCAGDPRNVLKRAVERARGLGFSFNVGPELEFYYSRGKEAFEPLDNAGYFDLTTDDHASDLRRDTILTLEKMSIPVEYSHHESSPSQQEIDLRYADAISVADAIMTYRLVVKEVALAHGVYATFMPKPAIDLHGSGMHLHQSLFDEEGTNVFHDPSGLNLSATAKSYIAGLLAYAPAYCAITNQHVNSYKRLAAPDAPNRICWSHASSRSIVRVPAYRPEDENATRVELSVPDAAANPYLALSVTLAAGLQGIEEGLTLGDPLQGSDVCEAECMPPTLSHALDRLEDSSLMKEVLGDRLHAYLLEYGRRECTLFNRDVSAWETERYFSRL
ncbi:MAG: glutamine synthetase family protein [Coriobacteriales bacterium]|jgi:glutamine synthetase